MASPPCNCFCFVIIIIIVYYVGFNNIMDFIVSLFDYIPILNIPIHLGVSIIKFMYNHLPFYKFYAFVICAINVVYQIFIIQLSRNRRGFNSRHLSQALVCIGLTLMLPVLVSLILINWNLVIFLILPFHLAATAHHVSNNGPPEFNCLRNFILFILIMPFIYSPIGIFQTIFSQPNNLPIDL